jgi:hypothetical protein
MADSGLRAALLETLGGLMATDQAARSRAEEQVKALEVTDEFGLHLTELTLQPEGALPLRQVGPDIMSPEPNCCWLPHQSIIVLIWTTRKGFWPRPFDESYSDPCRRQGRIKSHYSPQAMVGNT